MVSGGECVCVSGSGSEYVSGGECVICSEFVKGGE